MRSRLRDHNLNETQMDRNRAMGRVILNNLIFVIALLGIIGMVVFSLAHRGTL